MSEEASILDLGALDEPAYIWVGRQLPPSMLAAIDYDEDDNSFPMLVGTNRFKDFPISLKPVAEYFHALRRQQEALSWLKECGADDDALDWLVEQCCVIRIDPIDSLASFASVHLENNGMLKAKDDSDFLFGSEASLVMIGNDKGMEDIELSEVMADLLFGYYSESLPEAVKQCAVRFRQTQDEICNQLFSYLPALLRDGYAFLLYIDQNPETSSDADDEGD